MMFDRQDVFIGSLNLDPRSGDINTEAGLYGEKAMSNQKLSAGLIGEMLMLDLMLFKGKLD